MTRWNPAQRIRAVERAESFLAILGPDGVMIGKDDNVEDAIRFAEKRSPSGTVLVDETVYATSLDREDRGFQRQLARGADNPPDLSRAPVQALKASRIPTAKIGIDWSRFDPSSADGKATVKEARERLREHGQAIYDRLLEQAAGEVHVTQKRGGVAADFRDNWLTRNFLRQNMKMKKVLDTGDSYDSIGLSLLPHGSSFREPFSTSTDQGAGGATNCLYSTAECRKVCLVNTGQRALESGSFAASYLFSHLLRELPEEFLVNVFERSVKAFADAGADGFYRFIRLNVLSDLPWELVAPGFLEAVCEYARHQLLGKKKWAWTRGLAFYDYTVVRVMQPDPDAPPFVVATQDPDNRKLLPVLG